MRKLLFSFICLFILSCEKEPDELIIGGWSDNNSPDGYRISFNEDGTYHWGIPIATLDPNCGGGTYSTLADTLVKIENGEFGIDTSRYIFEVDRKNLKLISLATQGVSDYTRIR